MQQEVFKIMQVTKLKHIVLKPIILMMELLKIQEQIYQQG